MAGAEPLNPAQIIRAAAAECQARGRPVVFVSGCEERGRPYRFNPQLVRLHHTATRSYRYDYPSLGIVRDGRSDLPGPLSQFGLGRHTGTIYVIAFGYANDGGGGGWKGYTGNGSGFGIEAENDGIGEPWGPEITESYLVLTTALLRAMGKDASYACRHAEWSSHGKIDTATSPFSSGNWIRARVAERLANTQFSKEDELFTPSPTATVHFTAGHSGLLLSAEGNVHGSPVITRRADGRLSQRWMLIGHQDGTASFVSRDGNLALDVPDGRNEEGTRLQVAGADYNPNQRFRAEQLSPFIARLWVPGTDLLVDVSGKGGEGAEAILWSPNGGENQEWRLSVTV